MNLKQKINKMKDYDVFDYKDVKEAINKFQKEYWKNSHTGDKFKKHITCDDLDKLLKEIFGGFEDE